MADNVSIIRDFCAAWSKLDADAVMAYFAPDPTYHNMPGPPLTGTETVRAGIERFLKGWSATTWDIVNIAGNGDVVIAERVDRIDAGGKHVDLPVVGVFEMKDGKIAAWRDYFDLATYTRAFA